MRSQARFFKALADETRLQILWLLLGQEELCVCDIMTVLGITQSKASRHLRYLYNLGLITDRREGLWMYYRLDAPAGRPWEKQLGVLSEMLASQEGAQALRERLQQRLRDKRQRLADPPLAEPAPA